jgi:hypothetical protein
MDYLSYSGRQSYLLCPKKYEFRYIKRIKTKSNPKDTMFGLVIGKLFEWFYNKKLWSYPTKTFLSLIEPAIDEISTQEGFNIRQTDPKFVSDLIIDLNTYVVSTLQIIKNHHLLTLNSKSEINLTTNYYSPKYDMTIRLGGRADFIHYKDGESWILDGKGSKHRERYSDSEQLIWYAVQHYILFHTAPTRLGFLFYRFPDDPIKWIEYDSDSIRKSIDVTFDVIKKVNLKMFSASPSTECRLCEYKLKCEEGTKFLASKKVETRIKDTFLDLDPV